MGCCTEEDSIFEVPNPLVPDFTQRDNFKNNKFVLPLPKNPKIDRSITDCIYLSHFGKGLVRSDIRYQIDGSRDTGVVHRTMPRSPSNYECLIHNKFVF
jgi:hypothetical protein